MALLEADRLFRFFHAGDEEVVALAGVTVSVEAGELVAVTGPSGSGKSTLLACLAGLDEPDGGTVRVAGQVLTRRSERERAAIRARNIGVLWQSGNLIDHLRVRDNVLLAQGFAGARDRRKADELLERLGLAERARAWPPRLSGGEASRAGLAVALAGDPPLLVADEPTGELDAATADGVLQLLGDHAARGHAVVVVTHSTTIASRADRTIRLRDGELTP